MYLSFIKLTSDNLKHKTRNDSKKKKKKGGGNSSQTPHLYLPTDDDHLLKSQMYKEEKGVQTSDKTLWVLETMAV